MPRLHGLSSPGLVWTQVALAVQGRFGARSPLGGSEMPVQLLQPGQRSQAAPRSMCGVFVPSLDLPSACDLSRPRPAPRPPAGTWTSSASTAARRGRRSAWGRGTSRPCASGSGRRLRQSGGLGPNLWAWWVCWGRRRSLGSPLGRLVALTLEVGFRLGYV